MDLETLAALFGIDPKDALAKAQPKPRSHGRFRDNTPNPDAETKRPRLPAGGFTRGADTTGPQTMVWVSHDAPTHVHKGRRVKRVLEEVRRYLLRRKVTSPGLNEIFPSDEAPTPESVPCDGEYIVRCAAPGGGHPAFPLLPAAYGTNTQYLMRAIATLHTLFGDATHIKCDLLIERIGKVLDRLRNDPREA